MKLKEVLVFKDAHHIDWNSTEEEVRNAVMNAYPYMSASEWVMTISSVMHSLRKEVKRIGVSRLYKQIMAK